MVMMGDLSANLGRAHEWLHKSFKSNSFGAGWGHSPQEEEPSEWGGTLDGIRALLTIGEPALSPIISDSVSWLKSQQRPDGGFGARELRYSSAEATAWVVISLAELGLRADNDSTVNAAVAYLQRCLDSFGGAATTPGDVQEPRALPTALILWALSLQSDMEQACGKIVTRLHRMQDSQTGGWGVRFGATPNAATTSQVLHALRKAGVPEDLDWIAAGIRYLVACQEQSGKWRNSHDEWFTNEMHRIPVRCAHFGTGWAVLALSGYAGEMPKKAADRGASYLMSSQQASGAWLFEDFDPTEHVWCTSQVVSALAEWHSARVTGIPPTGPSLSSYARDRVSAILSWSRASFLYLAVAALAAAQLRNVIQAAALDSSRFIAQQSDSIWVNVISSAIWAFLVICGGLAAKKISHRNQ